MRENRSSAALRCVSAAMKDFRPRCEPQPPPPPPKKKKKKAKKAPQTAERATSASGEAASKCSRGKRRQPAARIPLPLRATPVQRPVRPASATPALCSAYLTCNLKIPDDMPVCPRGAECMLGCTSCVRAIFKRGGRPEIPQVPLVPGAEADEADKAFPLLAHLQQSQPSAAAAAACEGRGSDAGQASSSGDSDLGGCILAMLARRIVFKRWWEYFSLPKKYYEKARSTLLLLGGIGHGTRIHLDRTEAYNEAFELVASGAEVNFAIGQSRALDGDAT